MKTIFAFLFPFPRNSSACLLALLLFSSASLKAGLLYSTSGNTITITGSNPKATGFLLIPSTINNLPVTAIGQEAFYGCTGLTSVTLPSSITAIGIAAFAYCTGLTSVTLPSSITAIGDAAFSGCTGLKAITVDIANSTYSSNDGILFNKAQTSLIAFPAGKIGAYTIPNSITEIGYAAFAGCTGLTSVTLPSSITAIGDWAFYGCTGLTSVTLPSSITYIGWRAFSGCTGLTSVTLPSSLTDIGDAAFAYCTGLTSVTLPSSITAIGIAAFAYCTGLTSVTLPSSITAIGDAAFSGCTGLKAITVDIANSTYSSNDGILFNKAQTSLIAFPAGKIGAYTIPNSITEIGYAAFAGCTGLTSVTLPSSITAMGDQAFYGCTGLTSVTLPSSITAIGQAAFGGCTGLTSVTLPSSITKIGDGAFAYCTGLTSVTLPSSITKIGWSAFEGCTGLTSVTLPSSLTDIGNEAFAGCTGLTSVTLPSSITAIGDQAFYGCTGLTSVTLPSSITEIRLGAFEGCTGLTSVYFMGNTPSMVGANVFLAANKATVYYIEGKTGWSSSFAGRPTAKFIPLLPVITSATTATATVSQLFTYTITITANNTPTSFNATGLPAGLSINTATGIISGTPTKSGTHTITLSASNVVGTKNLTLTLTVNPFQLSVKPATAVAAVGYPFRFAISFINAPARFTATGLPAGLKINPDTGVISGTPTTVGTNTISLTATDDVSTGTQSLTLTVDLAPIITLKYEGARSGFVLKVQDGATVTHTIEYSTDLKLWTPLETQAVGSTDLTQIDPQATTSRHRFYRVIKQ